MQSYHILSWGVCRLAEHAHVTGSRRGCPLRGPAPTTAAAPAQGCGPSGQALLTHCPLYPEPMWSTSYDLLARCRFCTAILLAAHSRSAACKAQSRLPTLKRRCSIRPTCRRRMRSCCGRASPGPGQAATAAGLSLTGLSPW